MNDQQNIKTKIRFMRRAVLFGVLGGAGLLFATANATAQTTNAFDNAADPAYSGGFSSGENGGFGFGAWAVTVQEVAPGSGGTYIAGAGPSWNLWNNSVSASTVAVRPFALPLAVGQSFSFQSRLNNLFNSDDTNAMVLQDASGNTLFSYYHTGFEANSENGSYTDATTSGGVAVGFGYNYSAFSSFTFTLNSATTYTFADNTSGHSFSGTLSGVPIAQVAFVRGDGSGVNPFVNGGDFMISELGIVSSLPPTFAGQTPTPGSYSAVRTNISLNIIAGGTPINTGTISFKVDGSNVTPSMSTVAATTTISYTPDSPLSPGATHTVEVIAADGNNSLFTNTWSFITGSPTLPLTLPGPFVTGNYGNGITLFSNPGEGWLGTNYDVNSSRTLYARFSMTFHDVAGETGGGGAFGGLEFYQDDNERFIIGNNWMSTMWSFQAGTINDDLLPSTPIVLNEFHTIVVRVDFAQGATASSKIWLDPVFGVTEDAQPNPPYVLGSVTCDFNNIRLRCGNGSAYAEFTNIVIAATSADVGFLPPVIPTFQHFVPGPNATYASPNSPISVEIVEGGTAISTSDIALNIDGNAVTPTITVSDKTNFVSYLPSVPFAAGSTHTVTVSLTDKEGTPYSSTWTFTVDTYPALPITLADDIDTGNGIGDITILNSLNGCIDSQYGTASSQTLYVSVRMAFAQMAAADGGVGVYGGLEFYQGNTERFLIGNNWLSGNWSLDVWGTLIAPDLLPPTQLVTGEYHTMVARIDFVPGTNANVKVWLDPDLTQREGSQTYDPTTFSTNITFDNIRLRAGTGDTWIRFSGITLSGTTLFAPEPPAAPVLSISKQGDNVQVSWTGTGTLQQVSTIDGTWSDSANQANPQTVAAANSALFFRIKQ